MSTTAIEITACVWAFVAPVFGWMCADSTVSRLGGYKENKLVWWVVAIGLGVVWPLVVPAAWATILAKKMKGGAK